MRVILLIVSLTLLSLARPSHAQSILVQSEDVPLDHRRRPMLDLAADTVIQREFMAVISLWHLRQGDVVLHLEHPTADSTAPVTEAYVLQRAAPLRDGRVLVLDRLLNVRVFLSHIHLVLPGRQEAIILRLGPPDMPLPGPVYARTAQLSGYGILHLQPSPFAIYAPLAYDSAAALLAEIEN